MGPERAECNTLISCGRVSMCVGSLATMNVHGGWSSMEKGMGKNNKCGGPFGK